MASVEIQLKEDFERRNLDSSAARSLLSALLCTGEAGTPQGVRRGRPLQEHHAAHIGAGPANIDGGTLVEGNWEHTAKPSIINKWKPVLGITKTEDQQGDSSATSPMLGLTPGGLRWSHALRGEDALPRKKVKDEEGFLGGLRRAGAAVARLPHARRVGAQIRGALQQALEADANLYQSCLRAIGSEAADAGPPEDALQRLRQTLGSIVGCDSPDPFDPKVYDCEIAGSLLEAWTQAAGDPDWEAASWPRTGAPAGILEHPEQVGVFPPAKEASDLRDPLTTEFDAPETRNSYASVEECPPCSCRG